MFTDDVEYLFGDVDILSTLPSEAPAVWSGYVSAEGQGLDEAIEREFRTLFPLMPKTCEVLRRSVREAFLASDGLRTLRVLNQEIDKEQPLYSYMSKPPVSKTNKQVPTRFFQHAPRDFANLYEHSFDGLFDASRSGLLSLSDMTPLSDLMGDLSHLPWFPKLGSMPRLEEVAMIFSSGGGGYLFLDLRIDQSLMLRPTCILVTNDADEEPEISVDLWEYLDVWTSISMGA